MKARTTTPGLLLLLAAALACGGDAPRTTPGAMANAAGGGGLTGAGATFPNPIYAKWFDAYNRETGVRINYQSIGSGGGIRQFTEGTVDFGATDGPMTDEQIAKVQGNVKHLPTVIGATVVTYNLAELGGTRLNLDGPAVADIFLGKITKWNDPRIAALNAGASLPAKDIIVVHRSDGSGTTFIFTDFLAKVSPEWKTKVGAATSVSWPAGLGGKGNEGVTQQVQQTPGSIGYVEYVYALANKLAFAAVRNRAGTFVAPSTAAVSAAAGTIDLAANPDFRVSITDPEGAEAYPIASMTWLLVRPTPTDSAKHARLKAFLEWMVSEPAQKMAADLDYAPLPVPVLAAVRAEVAKL